MNQKDSSTNYGLLALRVTAGLVFIFMGWGKLTGIEMFTGMLGDLGFPAAAFWAYLVAIVEFLGGLGLLFGVYLRFFAKLLAIVMIVALLVVHAGGPFKEMISSLALLGSTLALAFMGGGAWMLTQKDWSCKPFKS